MKQIVLIGGAPLLGMLLIWVLGVVMERVQSVRVSLLRQALTMLGDATVATVHELQQTVVEAAKAANKDGVLTSDEVSQIKKLALEVIKRNLGKRGLKLISDVFGLAMGAQMDGFLSGRIESTLHETIKDPL